MALKPGKANIGKPKKGMKKPPPFAKGKPKKKEARAVALNKSFGPPAKTFDEAGARAKKRIAMLDEAEE
jgi:hypothetical protein